MEKLKIHIILLGGLKFSLNIRKIQKWNSRLFEIHSVHRLTALPDTVSTDGWYYSDEQLKRIIGDTLTYKVVVAIINAPLENDFYGRRIADNIYVLSLYETGHIILKNDLGLEQFIIQNLYYVTAIYYKFKGQIPSSDKSLTHQDIRGCLFDFNADKQDIAFSLGKVSICDTCKSEFDAAFIPDNFVDLLRREIKRIRKPTYYRLRDFIRRRPIISLLMAILASILINVFANYVFEAIKKNTTNERDKSSQIPINQKYDKSRISAKDSLKQE